MIWITVFNAMLLLLAAAIAAGLLPLKLFGSLLNALHNTIGITTPTPRQVQWVAIVWLLSTLLIVDSLAILLKFVF
jgi:hypothetical protein